MRSSAAIQAEGVQLKRSEGMCENRRNEIGANTLPAWRGVERRCAMIMVVLFMLSMNIPSFRELAYTSVRGREE